MPGRKVKIAYIECNTERRVTYKRRKIGFLNKAQQLRTLCGCEVANVRYNEFDKEPVVIPNYQEAVDTFRKFKALHRSNQLKHMTTTKTFTEKKIKKMKEQLRKLRKKNNIKEKENMMYDMLDGSGISIDMNPGDLNDLMFVIKQNFEKIYGLKIKADEEGPTLNASQPIQMNNYINNSDGFSQYPASYESIDWIDDDIISFFDDSYFNNINVQDQNHNNNL